MVSKTIKNELIMLLPKVIMLDITVYLLSIFFWKLNYSVALGLVLGTIVMYINLILIGISTENAIFRYKMTANEKKAKTTMLANYFLRYLLIGLAVYLSFSLKFSFLFNTFGVVIPLFYPKLIYVAQSIFIKKRKGD